jgi:tetratricopeptide (TPR) repeat protein
MLGALSSTAGSADERYMDFVHKLQEQGLADMAMEYLKLLQQRDDVPAEIKDELDFELARTMIMQSEESDAETERRLLDEAAKTLTKFLAEHKESENANDALAELAGVQLKQGQQIFAKSESEKDAAKKTQLRADARKTFELAKQSLQTAVAKYREQLGGEPQSAPGKSESEKPETKAKSDAKSKTKTTPKATTARKPQSKSKSAQKQEEKDPRVEAACIIARLNLALAEFFVGRTYDASVEAEKKSRTDQLNKAAESFDNLFQEYRGAFAGHIAHLWHGRSLEEQGDLRHAIMIYDEVLVNEPPKGERIPKDQAALFTQAEVFRLSILNKQQKHTEVIPEAQTWLNGNQDKRRTPHGLGIQLELAKANIGQGLKMGAGSGERRGVFARAMQIINNEVAKFPSPYQNEAFKLRTQHAGEVSAAGAKIASFDEGQFVGDAALAKDPPQYAEAITAYEQAIALANDKTDEDERDATTYRLGFGYFKTGNIEKAVSTAEGLARAKPQSRWAPDCAALALVASSSAYAAAKTNAEKQTQMAKLASMAKYLEDKWPRHSQAEVARRTMAGILMYRREFLAAAEIYERINPGSPLYAEGQSKAGQSYWNAYLTELGKPESERDTAAMAQWLEKASASLERSVEIQRAATQEGAEVPVLLVETQLLFAEIELKTGGPEKALQLLEPLLPLAQSGDRKELAALTIRILVGAMEAAIAQNDLAKAESLMGDLEKQGGGDTTRITQVLVGLGRGLEQQLRQHQAAGRSAEAESVRKSYETFLEKLGARELQNFGSLQYLAESYFAMGIYDKAGETFERMIQFAKTDPAFAQTKGAQSELQRVRLRRATSLRLTKKFELALGEVETLLKENERLLAAVMEKGRVLQDWGGQTASKFADAAKHWDQASRKVQNMSPRPAEYFEARYGLAFCLSKTGKKDDAVKVLRSTMTLSPAVGGPETRGKFESLLKELDPTGPPPASKTAASPSAAPAGNP